MEHRDLIKDQIEQLGKVLARILSDFMGFKSEGKTGPGIEVTNESLKSELDLDIELILSKKEEELSNYFKAHKLTDEHIEEIADYLFEIGEHSISSDKNYAKTVYNRVLKLFKIVDGSSNSYSFDRINKKGKVELALSKINKI